MPLPSPAKIRALLARAGKVAETARGISDTGRAFAAMVDELVALIGALREELDEERRQRFIDATKRQAQRRRKP